MNKVIIIWLLFTSASAVADQYSVHSRLELGIGLFALSTPDYRGSTHTQNKVIPFPYIKYRGERLRVDNGVEGRLFKAPDLLLSLSGNGTLPSSDNNPEREGMDELDATAEIGPSLEYRLFHDESNSLWLELPVRIAISIGDNIDLIGLVIQPRLAWRKPAAGKYDWRLRFATGPLFANQSYHDYYYDVQDDEVTATRPAFNAEQGYSGYRADFSYSKRINKLWLGGFIRFDSINEAVFELSPLVNTSSNWTAGIGLVWVLSEK